MRGDEHSAVVLASQSQGGASGQHAFGHLAAEAFKDLRQLAPLAECLPYGAVARERACAGEHKVAGAAKPGEGLAPATAGHGKTCNFGNTASDERSRGVV